MSIGESVGKKINIKEKYVFKSAISKASGRRWSFLFLLLKSDAFCETETELGTPLIIH